MIFKSSWVYSSTNWPPFTGGQNSILNWVLKLNLLYQNHWLQERLGRQENALGRQKNLWYVHITCHFALPFSVVVGRRSHRASLTQAKRDLKMENIRSLNDAWKDYLKTWDRWNSQRFQGHCPVGCLQRPRWTLQLQWPTYWHTLGYGHETQSFISKSAWLKPWSSASISVL